VLSCSEIGTASSFPAPQRYVAKITVSEQAAGKNKKNLLTKGSENLWLRHDGIFGNRLLIVACWLQYPRSPKEWPPPTTITCNGTRLLTTRDISKGSLRYRLDAYCSASVYPWKATMEHNVKYCSKIPQSTNTIRTKCLWIANSSKLQKITKTRTNDTDTKNFAVFCEQSMHILVAVCLTTVCVAVINSTQACSVVYFAKRLTSRISPQPSSNKMVTNFAIT